MSYQSKYSGDQIDNLLDKVPANEKSAGDALYKISDINARLGDRLENTYTYYIKVMGNYAQGNRSQIKDHTNRIEEIEQVIGTDDGIEDNVIDQINEAIEEIKDGLGKLTAFHGGKHYKDKIPESLAAAINDVELRFFNHAEEYDAHFKHIDDQIKALYGKHDDLTYQAFVKPDKVEINSDEFTRPSLQLPSE